MPILLGRVIIFSTLTFFLGSGAGYGLYEYSAHQVDIPKLEETSEVKPTQDIRLHFTTPMYPMDYRELISISPSRSTYVHWEDDFTTLVFSPKEYWKPDTTYTITLPEGKTRNFAPVPSAEVAFQTVKHPEVLSTYPIDGAKDVIVDIEDPITAHFSQSTEGFFLKFELTPEEKVVYQNNPKKTTFEILPEESIRNGESYRLRIYSKYKAAPDFDYEQIYEMTFETLPPPAELWSNNFSERLEQAKRFTRPKITEGKYIDINTTSQIMTAFENGQIIDTYLISSGKPGMETPKGEYEIQNKARRPWSRTYELYMPFWMAITPDGKYGIHELPEWPGGYKEGANHLGIPVSHGCVRLGIGAAESMYSWAEIGTPVIVH